MKKILIIDDDQSERCLMAAALRQNGFEAIQAADGAEGLELAGTQKPDLILSDVNMPELDGYDLLHRLRTQPSTCAIPVILMTGAPEANGMRHSMEQGADDYLAKPFDAPTLLAAVEMRLERIESVEQPMREVQSRMLAIVSATPNLVAIVEAATERLIHLNPAGRAMLGLGPAEKQAGWKLSECFQAYEGARLRDGVEAAKSEGRWVGECSLANRKGRSIPVEAQLLAHRSETGEVTWLSLLARDLTESVQLRHAQKMEAIGQLAAGIAHEINTPTQYVGDNIHFLRDSFASMCKTMEPFRELLLAAKAGSVTPELIQRVEKSLADGDVEYLCRQVPTAIEETLEGVGRVSKIVRAMKEFSHPGGKEKVAADINKAIESTVTVARNEWKYVAELKLDLDRSLPVVPCFLGEFNQVILNLIVNASHAVGDVLKQHPGGLGTITIITRRDGDWVEVRVADTGTGIPESVRGRIFEPFFTTKDVGQGTGQGLSVVYSSIVNRLAGKVTFETEVGKGTTFILRLPIGGPGAQRRQDNGKNSAARELVHEKS